MVMRTCLHVLVLSTETIELNTSVQFIYAVDHCGLTPTLELRHREPGMCWFSDGVFVLVSRCPTDRSRSGCNGIRRCRAMFAECVPKRGDGGVISEWDDPIGGACVFPLVAGRGPDLAVQAEVALMKGFSDGDTLGLLLSTVLPGIVGMALRGQPSRLACVVAGGDGLLGRVGTVAGNGGGDCEFTVDGDVT